MDPVWAVLIVLVLVLVSVALVGRRMLGYFSKFSTIRFPRALLSQTTLYPGDIILFTAHTHGYTNSLITNDFYSHASIVVRDPEDGSLYLSESLAGEIMPDPKVQDVEVMCEERARLSPLYARMKHYPGNAYLMRLTPSLTEEQSYQLWVLGQQQAPYPDAPYMMKKILPFFRPDRKRHCMEHVAWLLDSLGLAPQKMIENNQTLESRGFVGSGEALTNIHGKPLGRSGALKYLRPVQLYYDLDVVTVPEPWQVVDGYAQPV